MKRTLVMQCTTEEHAAIQRLAAASYNGVIGDFLREAVVEHCKRKRFDFPNNMVKGGRLRAPYLRSTT